MLKLNPSMFYLLLIDPTFLGVLCRAAHLSQIHYLQITSIYFNTFDYKRQSKIYQKL